MEMPILFVFGPFKIYTLSLFLVMAFLWSGFVISRKAAEYHLGEIEIFDGLVLTLIGVWGLSRLVTYLKIDGLNELVIWLVMILSAAVLSKREETRLFTVLDIFALGLMMVLAWWNLGLFWAGDLTGKLIDNNLGINVLVGRAFPVELLSSFLYLLTFMWLWRTERTYRTINWYKGRKSTANTGFIFAVALILFGLINAVSTGLRERVNELELIVSGITFLSGLIVIYWQAERNLKSDLRLITGMFVRKA